MDGVSPTYGYLTVATRGPFADFFQALSGNLLVDILFMVGLFFVGLTLTFGVLVRLGGSAGMLMLILIYISGSLPPEHNPLIDEHIIYALTLLGLTTIPAGDWLGLGKLWKKLAFVRQHPLLH